MSGVPEVVKLVVDAEQNLGSPWSVRSDYVERYWLPTLGPTAISLLRFVAELVESGVWSIPLADLARALGLGPNLGRNHQLLRSLDRLDRYGVVSWSPTSGVLVVPDRMPWLSPTALGRLPAFLAERHAGYVAEEAP